jgi:hypothetical protein
MGPQDAQKEIVQAQARFTQTKDQAIETAKSAATESASAASHASFLAFVALLIGAVAAGIEWATESPTDTGRQ